MAELEEEEEEVGCYTVKKEAQMFMTIWRSCLEFAESCSYFSVR
jgi:hypothetical protein